MADVSWPGGARSAVSITFDNLGEANDLELGLWPDDEPVGAHFSALEVLPRIREMLAGLGVRSTFFLEGWNASVYPDEIRRVSADGHEIAYHAWRHEAWINLNAEQQRDNLRRGRAAFEELGFALKGFRPPGGLLPDDALDILAAEGFTYCSAAAERPSCLTPVPVLPFVWHWLDAYYYYEPLAPLRRARGDSDDLLSPRRFGDEVRDALAKLKEEGGYTALVFHPFLEQDAERFDQMEEIVTRVAEDPQIWSGACDEVAEWLLSHRDEHLSDPRLDDASWR